MTSNNELMIFRPGIRPHVVLGLTLGGGVPLILFIIAGYIRGFESSNISEVIFLLSVWFFTIQIWIGSHRIILSSNDISSRTLFKGWKTLKKGDIRNGFFSEKLRADNVPPYSLTLTSEANASKQKIIINMRLFRLQDMQKIKDWLGDKATGELKGTLFKKRKK